MISRLMLNLHETADLGIFSTREIIISTHMDYVADHETDSFDITNASQFAENIQR